ncbi:hypothetical protein [Actinophytocola sp.]|uniref:hypothetical protein n=1 Tax=Actinophytocola sp. TaxID=1872138 RepID=UPI0025B99F5A|nr:hypothetical protein [Actinophytocola sp.]
MTSAGIVVNGGARRWWAWAALRLTPAAPEPAAPAPVPAGATHNVFAGIATNVVQAHSIDTVYLPEPAAPDDRPWLRALWDLADAAGAVVELRHLRTDRLATVLLVRTVGVDERAARGAADRLRHACWWRCRRGWWASRSPWTASCASSSSRSGRTRPGWWRSARRSPPRAPPAAAPAARGSPR